MSNEFGKGAGLGFLVGWLTGRRGRRRNRVSPVLFIFGGLGLFMSCAMTLFVAPASFFEARAVADYPRPTAEEIDAIEVGTAVLFQAQIPPEVTADEDGLVFAYREVREQDPATPDPDGAPSSDQSAGQWKRQSPPPNQIALLAGERLFTVTMPNNINYSNAQTIELPADESNDYRAVGFLPGQTLTINGSWQGGDTFIADTLHAGSAEAYQETLNQLPGRLLIFGLICGGISLLMFGVGVVLRFAGN